MHAINKVNMLLEDTTLPLPQQENLAGVVTAERVQDSSLDGYWRVLVSERWRTLSLLLHL